MARYVIGFLLALGLIILVIILIIKGLTSGGKSPLQTVDLNSYANTGTTVQLIIDSPVTASSQHHDIIINIGNNQASLQVTQGYEGEVVRSKTYPMNVSAYDVFLRSLNLNGFTQSNNDPNLKDERGHCALGDRYIYEVIDETGNDLQRYWSTTCNTGTFKGNIGSIQQLFQKQIPDYGELTNDVQL